MEDAVRVSRWMIYIWPVISVLLGVVAAVVTAVFKSGKEYGKFEQILNQKLDEFTIHLGKFEFLALKVEKMDREMIRRPDCDLKEKEQNQSICKKIDGIHNKLSEMDNRREKTRDIIDARWLEVFERLGAIESSIDQIQRENRK